MHVYLKNELRACYAVNLLPFASIIWQTRTNYALNCTAGIHLKCIFLYTDKKSVSDSKCNNNLDKNFVQN